MKNTRRQSRNLDRLVYVDAPEQIQLTFELAGVGTRMMAYLIDFSIRAVGITVLTIVISIMAAWTLQEAATGVILLIMFLVEWGYHTLFEWLWNGSTPGKRALGIRVVRSNGSTMDFTRTFMRNLLRGADIFPFAYGTGIMTMFFTRLERRLGDLAADAMVVREKREQLRNLPPISEYVEELDDGQIDSLGLSEQDLAEIDEFFRRRSVFSKERAEELAGILASPIVRRIGKGQANPIELLGAILSSAHRRRSSILTGSNPGVF